MTVKGAWTPEKVRQRIQVGVLLKDLEKQAQGKLEMSNNRLKAAIYLIDQAIGKPTQPLSSDPSNPIVVNVTSYAGK